MPQINARDWVFEVTDDPEGSTWTEVSEVTSFTLSNSANEESVDTTTFQSNGQHESQAMQRGATLTIEGRKDPEDEGQQLVEQVAGEVGEASLGGVRFRHADDEDWTVWTAWMSLGDNGGGNNDKTSWSATFNRSGPASTDTGA